MGGDVDLCGATRLNVIHLVPGYDNTSIVETVLDRADAAGVGSL